MDLVYDTLLQHLPFKRKKTPSGWLAFHVPVVPTRHNSRSQDKRGGLIANGDGGIS